MANQENAIKSIKDGSVRNIKADLFSHVFSDEAALVDLYRRAGKEIAVEDIEYLDLDEILQRTGRHKDSAFRTKDYRIIVFFEAQSTKNPNIPYRQLEYAVDSFRILRVFDFIGDNQNRFGSTLMEYPKVEFYIVYNGKAPLKDEQKQLVVDLGDIKVTAQVIDVRFHNLPDDVATDAENKVSGYSFFVQKFEELKESGKTPHQAYNLAVQASIVAGYLTDVWSRKECVDVFSEIFTIEEELKQEGREEGREEGFADAVVKMLENGLAAKAVADIVKRPVEWVESLSNKA